MAGDINIRGRIFGGFDRKDVVGYIEKNAMLSKQLRAEKDTLDFRCSELSSELEALKASFETVEAAKNEAESLNSELIAKTEAMRNEIETLRNELNAKNLENSALAGELSDAKETVALFESTKERLALLELNASRRAVIIENSARDASAEVLLRCRELISSFKAGYDEICSDAESTTAHIRGEMDKLGSRLYGLTDLLQKKSETLSELDNIISSKQL